MILAIDFDGVLHDHKNPIKGRRMGPPIQGSKEALTQLKQEGHELIIFSVWGDKPKTIEDWCKYWGVPYDSVTNIKPNADAYIDDKGIRFTTWDEVLPILTK